MIPVTQPFLPPLEEYQQYVKNIWDRNWLTNNGPLVKELEEKLRGYLKLNNLLFVTNGTIAIQLAIKALQLKGEIITTPFSYVATTSSIVWENCKPVFVDIDSKTLNIDPDKIEAAITKKTTAILATHVYGNPCAIEEIEKIAGKHKLKIIYDAAHGFGTKYKGKSIFAYGDVSVTSLHATKLFHSTEGGVIFSQNEKILNTMAFMRNFGHNGFEQFFGLGINGKNSEFHAAMGLVNLNYLDVILTDRKESSRHYKECLDETNVIYQAIAKDTEYNHAYFSLMFESEKVLLKVVKKLSKNDIGTRRYFYPTLNRLPYVKRNSLPVAEDISSRILCLPLYYGLSKESVESISEIITKELKK